MTEREMILKVLERLAVKIYAQDEKWLEFQSFSTPESVCIEFDENGNIKAI